MSTKKGKKKSLSSLISNLSTYNFLEPEEHDDYVSIRMSSFRRARILIALGIVALIALICLWMSFSWFKKQIDPPGEPTSSVQIFLPANSKPGEVASILHDNSVVPNSTFFRLWMTYRSIDDLQGGTYQLNENMSADEAINILQKGPAVTEEISFKIAENKWVSEILVDIASQLENATEDDVSAEDLQAVLDSGNLSVTYKPEGVDNWEGFLMPGEYKIPVDATAEEILQKPLEKFNQVVGPIGFGAAKQSIDQEPYTVLIIASLIEAETILPEDKPRVAQVLNERLRKNLHLDIVATSLYSSGDRELSGIELTNQLSDSEDPYNTNYRGGNATIDRLPPTPIGSVSEDSMKAALNPASGTFLYYVLESPETGQLIFSLTEEEHENAKDIARANGVEVQ